MLMFFDLIQNFWLGFIITATPGAVLAEVLRRTLQSGLHLTQFLLGNFVGMVIVIVLAFAGFSILQDSVTAQLFFFISGCILLFIGVSTIIAKPHNLKSDTPIKDSSASALTIGVTLAVANPLSFIFWISLIGGFRNENTIGVTLLNILSVILGALTVFVVLAILAKKLRTIMSARREHQLVQILGTIIVLYSLAILYKVLA